MSSDREQSQQQPHLFRASENSAEPLARDDGEEPRDIDDDWLIFDFNRPFWSDEDSEDREQNQQQPHVSSAAENSADLLARDDEEEPRDVDGPRPAGPASTPSREDEDSEDWEPPRFFVIVENSAELPARDAEEEPRDNQGAQPAGPASPPVREDEDSELLQVHEQERRNVTLNSQEQVDGSGNGAGANDAPVAGPAPVGQGVAEERTARPDAPEGVVIRCPICMDYYSEIMQNGRQLMSTLCGHVFCSRCLPIALENAYVCPTCRVILSPELHHPIYL